MDGAASIIYSHGVDLPECMLTAESLKGWKLNAEKLTC